MSPTPRSSPRSSRPRIGLAIAFACGFVLLFCLLIGWMVFVGLPGESANLGEADEEMSLATADLPPDDAELSPDHPLKKSLTSAQKPPAEENTKTPAQKPPAEENTNPTLEQPPPKSPEPEPEPKPDPGPPAAEESEPPASPPPKRPDERPIPEPAPRPRPETPVAAPEPPSNPVVPSPPNKEPPIPLLPKPAGQKPIALLPLDPLDLEKPGLVLEDKKSNLKHKVVTFETGSRAKRLRLAVTPPRYDNLGSLLNQLGPGFSYTQISPFDLVELSKLTDYDVVFINCGTIITDSRVHSTLRAYVQQGGTIYASDLMYQPLAKAFPEYTIQAPGVSQLQGLVPAAVKDAGLKKILGKSVPLNFDLSHSPALFTSKKAKIYLETYRQNTITGKLQAVPVLTRFTFGKGSVIYTSFHNSKQINQLELKLLMSIVFTTVNSEVENKADTILKENGYGVQEVKNLGLSQGYSLSKQPLNHPGGGHLCLALSFRNEGAKLRLKLFTPEGKVIQHTDTDSFFIEIEDAPSGEWHYAVTALEAPYENFPFSLITTHPKSGK